MKVHVLIPALNPCERLAGVIDELLCSDAVVGIVVVNDGSEASRGELFQALAARPRVNLLQHKSNLGKGAALRTGIRFFLGHAGEDAVLVTADADGQHLPSDILAVAKAGMASPGSLVLGTRGFLGDVPFRSRFGNDLTRFVFRLFTGWSLADTQTGLRAIPRCFLEALLAVETNRYAFELEMLLLASRLRFPVTAVPVQTVYLEGNAASHFRPVVDSLRICRVFARYLLK